MAPWAAFLFGGVVGIAVCITAYAVYKTYYDCEEPYKQASKKSKSEKTQLLKTIEELKEEISQMKNHQVYENSELRHRNVQKKEHQQINAPRQQPVQETVQQTIPSSAPRQQPVQEPVQQTIPSSNSKTVVETAEIEIQTDDLPLLSIDQFSIASPSVSEDSVSTCSFDSGVTIVEEVDDDVDECTRGLPRWNELGDAEKALMTCINDEDPIETVAVPCGHAYFCARCAPVYFRMDGKRPKCPKCRNRIASYYNINVQFR